MKKNILIYPCGADNAIEVYKSINHSVHLNVYGANSLESVSDLIFDKPILNLPNIDNINFINELNRLIDSFKIDVIFPTHDAVIYFLSKNQSSIKCKIIGGDPLTNEIARYKKNTYHKFNENDFSPKLYNSISEINDFPVFIKPNIGHGSVGAKKIILKNELNGINEEEYVITEYLPGKEFTVDCFTDKNGELLYSFARERYDVRNGVSSINIEGSDIVQQQVLKIAKEINKQLLFNGLWFFQVKEDSNGKLKLLEICTRIATTMAFARYKGVNLPLLSIFSNIGYEVKTLITNQKVKLFRYSDTKVKFDFDYDNVYLDFDDTLILNDKVCLNAIAFVYQCLNNNKHVFLITKHQYDIFETLKKYQISTSLFKKIIVIPMDEPKYKYINHNKSIFIDNYYYEREEVFNKLGIPVFDVDLIDALIIN